MGPIDYSSDLADPLAVALQGYQIGQQMRAQRQAEEQAIAQQEAAQRKAEAMSSLMRPGVTFNDYQRVMQMFPDEAKGLTEQWTAMDKVKQSTFFNAGGEAYALLQPGPDGAIDGTRALDKLESYAAAADNSGDKDTAQKLRDMANYIKTNPAAGKATIGSVLAVVDGERFKNVATQTETTPMQRQYDWLKTIKGQEYADRWLAVETDKFVPVSGVGVFRGSDLLAPGEASGLPPSAANVPPPQIGENGLPLGLTQEQYNVTVQAMGKDKTDKWMKANNIPLIQKREVVNIKGKKFYKVNGQWFDNPEGL